MKQKNHDLSFEAVWATDTYGSNARRLEIRPDGYMALTNDDGNTVKMLSWPYSDISKCRLEIKDDALVLYGNSTAFAQFIHIWSSSESK